jgi:hypothetical protein
VEEATGVAAGLGTEYAADDEQLVWVHSHIYVEPLQIIEEHLLRRKPQQTEFAVQSARGGQGFTVQG